MTRPPTKPPPTHDALPLPRTGHDPLEGIASDGAIVTGAHRSRFAPAFQPVLASAIDRVVASGQQVSLYVYGSVATGTARVGLSDVDLVTVGLAPAAAAHIARDLSAEHAGLCRSVDIGAAQRADYEGPGDEAHGNRVFLRHYCVHLAGPDVGRDWPEFPADRAAARGFNGDIGLCAARWRSQALQLQSAAMLGRRVARKTLLAVAGLVSVHDATWTTDRTAAACRWGVIRPDLAAALQTLVSWSDSATSGPSPAEVLAALDGVVAEIVRAFERDIGLWR